MAIFLSADHLIGKVPEFQLSRLFRFFEPLLLPRNAVVVNQKAFDALDKAAQDAVLSQATAAEQRGWATSERKDAEYIKELAAKGMKIEVTSPVLKRELKAIGDQMTADWLKTAGDDGKAIIEAFNKK